MSFNSNSSKSPEELPFTYKLVHVILDRGLVAKYPAKGLNMAPVILDDDPITVVPVSKRAVLPFDIVLYEKDAGTWSLGRVVGINGNDLTLLGDSETEPLLRDKSVVKAVVTKIETKDKVEYHLDSSKQRAWGAEWYAKVGERKTLVRSTSQEEVLCSFQVCAEFSSSMKGFDPSAMYHISPDHYSLKLGEEMLVIPGGDMIDLCKLSFLNPTAQYLWENLSGKRFDARKMAELLTGEYDVSFQQALCDSEAVLRSWLDNGLLKDDAGAVFDGDKAIIPHGVTEIKDDAFHGLTDLVAVEIPDTVTRIGRRAFCRCSSLTGIKIPEGVMEIGDEAFCLCTGLRSIEIPKGIKKVGSGVLAGSRPKEVILRHINPDPGLKETVFEFFRGGSIIGVSLLVPAGSEELYRQEMLFSLFDQIKPIP